MRKSLCCVAVTLVLLSGPAWAAADDQQIAQQIIEQLKEHQSSGRLKGFNIDLSVEQGRVWLKGDVANDDQHQLAINTARHVPGVKLVVNDLKIQGEAVQHPAEQAQPQAEEKPSQPTASPIQLRQPSTSLSAAAAQPKKEEAKAEAAPQESVELRIRPAAQPQLPTSTRSVVAKFDAPVPASQNELALVAQEQEELAEVAPQGQQGPTMVAYPQQQQVAPQMAYGQQGPGYWVPVQPQTGRPTGPVAFAPSNLPGSPAQAPQSQALRAQQMMAMQAHAQAMAAQGMHGPVMPVQGISGQPMQMQPAPQFIQGTGGGVMPATYDHPSMPAYAWPSYASYPNYAALQYPRQYSAHAWPYIGPFYPYPQVPLGWRKVTLSWDDGWWFLDFKDKGYGPYVTR